MGIILLFTPKFIAFAVLVLTPRDAFHAMESMYRNDIDIDVFYPFTTGGKDNYYMPPCSITNYSCIYNFTSGSGLQYHRDR